MASKKSGGKKSGGYGTVKIENNSSILMRVYVTDPDGKEHFIQELSPGDVTVQFTPRGATWTMRPEVDELEFVADEEENVFTITHDDPDRSRGGSLTTMAPADGDAEDPERPRGGSLTT